MSLKKFMSFDQLDRLLKKQFQISDNELKTFLDKNGIQPTTKITNIPMYELEDNEKIYNHFAEKYKNKPKKATGPTKPAAEAKEKKSPVKIEKEKYTVAEMAETLNIGTQRIYRFIKKHNLEPTQTEGVTRYYSKNDYQTIITNFSDDNIDQQTVSETEQPPAGDPDPVHETSREDPEDDQELSHEIIDDQSINDPELAKKTDSELVQSARKQVNEFFNDQKDVQTDPIADNTKQTAEEVEIHYLKRENELLREELEKANNLVIELTRRLEHSQNLNVKTYEMAERQQPQFKLPKIIEAEMLETSESAPEDPDYQEDFEDEYEEEEPPAKRSLFGGLFRK